MRKRYEAVLPPGYTAVYTVDATQKKTVVLLNLAGAGIMVLSMLIGYLLIQPHNFLGEFSFLRSILVPVFIVVYLFLHELLHGLAYKVLTRKKLSFGLTLSVAFCGVPNIYVYRSTALPALLLPFLVFLPIFLLPAVFCPDPWDQMCGLLLLSLHLGGCCGDLYDTALFLFRFKDSQTLMLDTGPQQTFYCRIISAD